MERLRVAQVITGLTPGGAERLLLDMLPHFDPERFDIHLASITPDLRALAAYGHEGTPVEVFDMRGPEGLRGLLAYRAWLRRLSPHVVHAHMFHAMVATVLASRALPHPPRICFTSHNAHQARARALTIRALRPWRAADIVFVQGQHAALNAPRTEVIPNGVSVPPRPPPRPSWGDCRPVRLISVGRLLPQKDPLGLLESVAALPAGAMRLQFVGQGPLLDEARARAAALGLADQVEFLGQRQDVRELLRQADIFVMHSRHEGMPMALLEAGAEAMPAVATPVGAVPSMLADGRGLFASADGFAAAIARFLADPGMALLAGRRFHDHVRAHHSIEATTRRHQTLYESLAAGRPGAPAAPEEIP